MKFKQFDYVSFPADKGSDEIREGFVFRVRDSQIDVVSARKKDGVNFPDFGFHKKYIEKSRFDEVKIVQLNKNITSWDIHQVTAWAMVRYYKTYGDFMTKHIKPHFEPPYDKEATIAEKISNIVTSVRHNTIARDRKSNRKVKK
jgi:hypothetical protein